MLVAASAATAAPLCTDGAGTASTTTSIACWSGSFSTGVISGFTISQTINWATTFGSADTNPNSYLSDYNPNVSFTISNPTTGAGGETPLVSAHNDINNVTLGPNYSGNAPVLQRLDNTEAAYSKFDGLYDAQSLGSNLNPTDPHPNVKPMMFNNTFDALAPRPSDTNWGDNLIGTFGSAGPITITFNSPISEAGFRISTLGLVDFQATVKAFSGATGGGTELGSVQLNTNGNGGGGLCSSLQNYPPTACNTAPFIGIDQALFGYNTNSGDMIKSITISTNDGTGGFALDTLMIGFAADQGRGLTGIGTPEPGTLLMLGCALALAGLTGRKRGAARRL